MTKETIDGIRKYYDFPEDVSDSEIETSYTGSLGEELFVAGLAIQNFKRVFIKEFMKIFK